MKYAPVVFFSIALVAVLFVEPWVSRYEAPESKKFSPIQAADRSVELLFVGDVMLGRHVEELMSRYGAEYPFKNVEELLGESDAIIANLEGPISQNHVRTPGMSMKFTFSSSTAGTLRDEGISIVSLANNHTYDSGPEDFRYTREALQEAGVGYFGHPFAFGPEYLLRKTINGRTFIFAGFNATDPNFDYEGAIAFVKTLHRENGEFLIAGVHGGEEYKPHSNAKQQYFYRSLIDAGADLVIGHHPHVVQEIEKYKGKLIFYSLGNFVFDQYFSKDVQEGLAIRAVFNGKGISYDLIPTRSAKSQPSIMIDPERRVWLDGLANCSAEALRPGIRSGQIFQELTNLNVMITS